MALTLEIGYYNTFILAGGTSPGVFHIEESRIKGGYNETSVDFGVKAHITDEEYETRVRENALIYSGIYNSKTKINKTNEFPIGASITKAVDIANGSIQKLYAEDTDLNILQENKVSRALIDKDAIYTAEGTPISTVSNVVIGQIVPYLGKYGISNNPESFAYYGGRQYFADKNRGVILRLTRDGLTPISMYGMKNFFRDNLQKSETAYGMYDEVKDQYVLSLQGDDISGGKKSNSTNPILESFSRFITLGFSELNKGWVSLYSYEPLCGTSLTNTFYTFKTYRLWEHYNPNTQRNKFYDATFKDPSYVKLIMNDKPSFVKNFLTVNYEGSEGWSMDSAESRSYNHNVKSSDTYTAVTETAYKIPKKGVTINDENGAAINAGFDLKENKFFKQLKNNNTSVFNDDSYFSATGLKGEYLSMTMQYWEPNNITGEEKAELFAVSNETQISSN